MFFRVKKIKGKNYAYLVENEWHKKGSRQRVKKYLGRVYRLELRKETDFQKFINAEDIERYVDGNDAKKIISDLINWELSKFNTKEQFHIDLENKKVQKDGKDVVLSINDGFMCGLTLKNLINFEPEGDEAKNGYRLARCFVEAGIKVPHGIFVSLFGKFYKQAI